MNTELANVQSSKEILHISAKYNAELFGKIIQLSSGFNRANFLLSNTDTLCLILKNLDLFSRLQLRSSCHVFQKIITETIKIRTSIILTPLELFDPSNHTLLCARNDKIDISIKEINTEKNIEDLVAFIKNKENKSIIVQVKSIEVNAVEITYDSEDSMKEFTSSLPSFSSLVSLSFLSKIWIPLDFPAMPNIITLHIQRIIAPITFGELPMLTSFCFEKIYAPITFPQSLPCLTSFKVDEITEVPETENTIKQFQELIEKKKGIEEKKEDES